MVDIHGNYDDLFSAVPSALAGLFDEGDAGASVAVVVDGEPVVDVWGGFADADRSIPWQRDTSTNVWSVTKTMTALCALVLADRGELGSILAPSSSWRRIFDGSAGPHLPSATGQVGADGSRGR